MATYPDVDLGHDSVRETDGGVKLAIASDGTPFTQDSYSTPWYVFRMIHPYIDVSDKDALEAFWEANKNLPFDLLPYKKDNVNYINCRFLPGGFFANRERGNYWTVQVQFRGEKQ